MQICEYVETLANDEALAEFIEADRHKELAYLSASVGRFEKILQWIPRSNRPLRLLDIGTTPFTCYLKQAMPHYDVWTLDRTDLMERRCREARVRLRVCDLDDAVLPFEDGLFDVVVFTEVLEHVFAPPTHVLAEVRRIMSPSGRLILGVPNIARLSKRLKLLAGISPLPHADHQLNKQWQHGHGHIHEFTKAEVLAHCRSAGLEVLRTRMFDVTTPWRMLRAQSRFGVAKFLYYCAVAPFPSLRGCIYVLCSKGNLR